MEETSSGRLPAQRWRETCYLLQRWPALRVALSRGDPRFWKPILSPEHVQTYEGRPLPGTPTAIGQRVVQLFVKPIPQVSPAKTYR